MLDLGANMGEFTRGYAALVGPTGYVLAVEADPMNAFLCGWLAKGIPQVHVLPVAVAGECGVRALHMDGQNSRRQSLWRENLTTDSERTVAVPTLTLDTLAASVPNLKGIKIDVQGAEMAVLEGGQETLLRKNLTWCIEVWGLGLRHAGATVSSVALNFDVHGWVPVGKTWLEVVDMAEDLARVQDVLIRHREVA